MNKMTLWNKALRRIKSDALCLTDRREGLGLTRFRQAKGVDVLHGNVLPRRKTSSWKAQSLEYCIEPKGLTCGM